MRLRHRFWAPGHGLSVIGRVFVSLSVLLAALAWLTNRERSRSRALTTRSSHIERLTRDVSTILELQLAIDNARDLELGITYAAGLGVTPGVIHATLGVDLPADIAAALAQARASIDRLGARAPIAVADVDSADGHGNRAFDVLSERVANRRDGLIAELRTEVSAVGGQSGLDTAVDDLTSVTTLNVALNTLALSVLNVMVSFDASPLETRVRAAMRTQEVVDGLLRQLSARPGPVAQSVEALRSAPTFVQLQAATISQVDAQLRAGSAGTPMGLADIEALGSVWRGTRTNQDLVAASVEVAQQQVLTAGARLAASAKADRARALAILLGAVAMVVVTIVWILRTVARPIRALEHHAQQLSNGERPDEPLRISGARELRTAAAAMNRLVDALFIVERQASALAAGEIHDDALREAVPGRLGDALSGAVARLSTSIADSRTLASRLEHDANHDGLTLLANRRAAASFLDAAIVEARAGAPGPAVLYIDLDRFKPVNDRYGHEAGDDVLRIVAGRLRSRRHRRPPRRRRVPHHLERRTEPR